MTVGIPQIDVEINNNSPIHTLLVTFEDVEVSYDPTCQQVYVKNTSSSDDYFLQYTLFGNTSGLSSLPYTAMPVGAQGVPPITLGSGEVYYPGLYFGVGAMNPALNIAFINCKMIWEDLTLTNKKGISCRFNMNNQHIRDNFNTILMSVVEPVDKKYTVLYQILK